MKRLLALLFVACATQLPLFAQGTIPFTISFPVFPGFLPASAELSGSSFTASVFIGSYAADYGRIVEMAEDGSTTPMFQFSSLLVDTYPPAPGFPGSGGGTFYSYFETWDLIPTQVESLLGGHWYMEVAFGSDTLLGQINQVPEPTSAVLFVSGVAIIASCCRQKLQR